MDLRSIRRAGGLTGLILLASTCTAAAETFEQHGAHEHGKLTLNVALEADTLTVELDSPAMNILGFEHAPRTADEKRAVEAAHTFLKAGSGMFGVPPAARCSLAGVSLTLPEWHEEGDHADYRARYTFTCTASKSLQWIEFWLLERFKNVTEARVNIVSASGQRSETVASARSRVSLW